MHLPSWLSLLALLATLPFAVLLFRGLRQLRQLTDQPIDGATPLLSIIIPARNEAATIEPALRSLLAADYPALELIAINDRSCDATGAILDRLAQEDSRLMVLHVEEIPAHWMGKSYALHLGAQRAQGEYLLFTDADIRFAPMTLRQAMAYTVEHKLDHLVVLPELQARSPLLRMLLVLFLASFLLMFRPWLVRHRRRRFAGVGAFNLVRRAVYEATGGHAAVAMTPLDDVLLGKRLKLAGATTDVLLGTAAISVDWYPSTPAMIRGLGKNGFAAFDYRLSKLVATTLLIVLVALWPLAGLFLGTPLARAASALTLFLGAASLYNLIRATDWPRWMLLLAPLATLISLFMCWRSALLALTRGTVDWRGTEYPLAELRARHF